MKEKIYLIPGLMTDERIWGELSNYLNEYELIHLTIPLSEDFEEIVDILNNNIKEEKINLLGFSLGGYIASYFAIKYPSKIKKLFLLSSTPSATRKKDVKKREKKLLELKDNKFVNLDLKKAYKLLEIKNEKNANIVFNMFNDLGFENFIIQLASTLNRQEIYANFKNLDFPIKLFYSKSDRLFNHESINDIISSNSKITIVSREGTSHNISLEVPEELSFEIKEWMT